MRHFAGFWRLAILIFDFFELKIEALAVADTLINTRTDLGFSIPVGLTNSVQ